MSFNSDEAALNEEIRQCIEREIPESTAQVNNQGNHFQITVTSSTFAGKGLLEKQRMVYNVLAPYMKGPNAPVHAVDQLKTLVA